MPRLKPLTKEQRDEAMRLFEQAQECIYAATRIGCEANGARYTDAGLKVCADIRAKLVEPLRQAEWDAWREAQHVAALKIERLP